MRGFARHIIVAGLASQISVMLLMIRIGIVLITRNAEINMLQFVGFYVVSIVVIIFTWLLARRSLALLIDLASGIPREVDRVREEGEYRFLLRFLTALFLVNVVLAALVLLRVLGIA